MGTVCDESQILVRSGAGVDRWECRDSGWQSFLVHNVLRRVDGILYSRRGPASVLVRDHVMIT